MIDRPKDCLELADRLSEYIDEELPQSLRRTVQDHFGDCADCEKFLESLRRMKNLGQWLPRPELEPHRLQAIAERIRARLGDE